MPSTAIRRFSYDADTQTLFVTFVDGDLYAYRGVPDAVHADMGRAFSKGRFFAERIRGHYAYAKLPPPGEDAPVLFTPREGTRGP
jgi:hypothetical protein